MHFGEKLRSLRKKKGVNQKEFAEFLQIHPSTYNRYERGVRAPSAKFLSHLASLEIFSRDELVELIRIQETEEPYAPEEEDPDALYEQIVERLRHVDRNILRLILEVIEHTSLHRND